MEPQQTSSHDLLDEVVKRASGARTHLAIAGHGWFTDGDERAPKHAGFCRECAAIDALDESLVMYAAAKTGEHA